MAAQIYLVDPVPLVWLGLRALLSGEEGFEIAGETPCGLNALKGIQAHPPDIAIIAYRLIDIPGAYLTAEITKLKLPTRVIAFSTFAHDRILSLMMEAGAMCFLSRMEPPEVVLEALRAAAQGNPWWSPSLAGRAAELYRDGTAELPALNDREIAILQFLARGWENRRIAEALCYGEQTVKNYLNQVYEKLGVSTRAGAVVAALRHGWISMDHL